MRSPVLYVQYTVLFLFSPIHHFIPSSSNQKHIEMIMSNRKRIISRLFQVRSQVAGGRLRQGQTGDECECSAIVDPASVGWRMVEDGGGWWKMVEKRSGLMHTRNN